MNIYSTPLTPGPIEHDPNGPDVQVHEEGDEVFITFSDDFLEKSDWRVDDEIIWEIGSNGELAISNPKAEVRKALRQKVDELLSGGAEL